VRAEATEAAAAHTAIAATEHATQRITSSHDAAETAAAARAE
jgi:hypothetical protein